MSSFKFHGNLWARSADKSTATNKVALDEPAYVPNAQLAIRSKLQDSLRDLGPKSTATVAFTLAWNLPKYFQDNGLEIPPLDSYSADTFDRIMSFTGTLLNAQALTVEEYMRNTWRGEWKGLRFLLKKLLVVPFGQEASCELRKAHGIDGEKPLLTTAQLTHQNRILRDRTYQKGRSAQLLKRATFARR